MATKKSLTEAAQAATNRFFSQAVTEASETAQEGRQAVGSSKVSPERDGAEKAVREAKKRTVTARGKSTSDTKVFSFRAWIDEVEDWRLYAAVKQMQIDELGAAALREYIRRHPVTDDERVLRDALLTVRSSKK